MKNLKKAASLILAVMMILSLAVPAFAAPEQGKITITNVEMKDGDTATYSAYKIFDIVQENGATSYTISQDSPWFDLVAMEVGSGRYQSKVNGITFASNANGVYTLTANVLAPGQEPDENVVYLNATEFVAAATAYYDANKAAIDAAGSTAFAKGEGNHPEATVDYGYYYVNTGMGALVNVNAANVSITDKGQNDMPFDKTIDKKTANVGEDVAYTITSKVPDTKDYTKYTYVIKDTLDDGLTLKADTIKVSLVGVGADSETIDITGSAGYTQKVEGNGFELNFDMKALTANKDNVGAQVVITYSATVNANAAANIEWNNASLTYTNKTKTETVTDKEYVHTFNLVIDKTDGGSNKLAGAVFALKNKDGQYYAVNADGAVSWVASVSEATTVTTDADGAASFAGLAAGAYELEEITAPEGYNKLNGTVSVVLEGVTDTEAEAIANGLADVQTRLVDTEEVANYSGNLLPETGGIGTTIFYIAGGVLVIGASVLLITRRRMAK